MDAIQALVLGAVQGLTEFLPVSSSGHLILVPALLGWEEQPLAFDAVVHLGTLAALLVGLRDDLPKLWRDGGRLGWTVLAASVPALGAGYLFKDQIESALRSPLVVAASLAFWGALLWVGDRAARGRAAMGVARVGYHQAMLIGAAQAIALIPGTSRSGVTITAGLMTGLSREDAARFSFLLGIPAVAAAGALGLLNVFRGADPVAAFPLAIGFLAAFGFGLLAIRFLLRLLKTSSFVPFAIYRLVLAATVVLIVA